MATMLTGTENYRLDCRFRDIRADRHTDMLITILRIPSGSEVGNKATSIQRNTADRMRRNTRVLSIVPLMFVVTAVFQRNCRVRASANNTMPCLSGFRGEWPAVDRQATGPRPGGRNGTNVRPARSSYVVVGAI